MTFHDTHFAPLFAPLAVGRLTLRNRIVMAPMTRQFSPGGVPGADVAAYYRRRAEGEAGLIITEGTGVDHPAALDSDRIPVMHGTAPLAGWRRVVDEVHSAGGLIFPQLWHQGVMRDASISRSPEVASLRPSPEFGPVGAHTVKPDFLDRAKAPAPAMTESEIADVIAAFGRSAAHAAAVGFDGIAIHGAHGYMIDGFLWAGTNRRTDRYGGDPARRARFAVEIVKAVRAAVGPALPIMLRFSNWKLQDYRARIADTPQELEAMLAPMAAAGVDIFDGSTRNFAEPTFEGSPLNLAGWAKKLTGKIAVTVGGVGLDTVMQAGSAPDPAATIPHTMPALVERLSRGEFDLVAVGRAILADPAWPRKIRRGEPVTPLDPSAFGQLI